jgi:hypothetical protein
LKANSRTSDSQSSDGGASRSRSTANSQDSGDMQAQRNYVELALASPSVQLLIPQKSKSFCTLMEEEQSWHLQMQAYRHLQNTIERITKPPRAERKTAPEPELLLCIIGAGTSSPIQVPLNLLNGSVHYHMVRVMTHANKAMEKIISTRPVDITKIDNICEDVEKWYSTSKMDTIALSKTTITEIMLDTYIPKNIILPGCLASSKVADDYMVAIMNILTAWYIRLHAEGDLTVNQSAIVQVLSSPVQQLHYSRKDIEMHASLNSKAPSYFAAAASFRKKLTDHMFHHQCFAPVEYASLPSELTHKDEAKKKDHIIAVRPTDKLPDSFFTSYDRFKTHVSKNLMVLHRSYPKSLRGVAEAVAYVHYPHALMEEGVEAKMPVEEGLATCMGCGFIEPPDEPSAIPQMLVNNKAAYAKPNSKKIFLFSCKHVLHIECASEYVEKICNNSSLHRTPALKIYCSGPVQDKCHATDSYMLLQDLLPNATQAVQQPNHQLTTNFVIADVPNNTQTASSGMTVAPSLDTTPSNANTDEEADVLGAQIRAAWVRGAAADAQIEEEQEKALLAKLVDGLLQECTAM